MTTFDSPRELTYWTTWGVFKKIKELTYVQRDILCLIAGCQEKGLNLLNHEIAEQLCIDLQTVKAALKELKKLDYVRTTKAKSSYRKILWTQKTKALVIKAKRELAKNNEEPVSTGIPFTPVDNSTGMPNTPVTGIAFIPQLGVHLYQSIKTKKTNQTNSMQVCESKNNILPKAKSSTVGSKQSVTNYFPSAAFEDFWSQVRFSKGDRFRSWEQWQRLRIEEKGLVEKVTAALAKVLPDWEQREPKYRSRVAHWLAEGPWESDNGDSVQAPVIRKFDGPGPTREFYQDRLDRLLLIPEDRRTPRDKEDIAALTERLK